VDFCLFVCLFFFVGGVVERFLGVMCHVVWTRIRVKLGLK
jgi:hypothetical protein